MRERGEHLGIYHIGSPEEVTIGDLARRIAHAVGREITLVPGRSAGGGPQRRCPDISKLTRLGYKPLVSLDRGLKPTLDWYRRNADLAPKLY
jgi:nucleoside-diphosphate-sugar epimerase